MKTAITLEEIYAPVETRLQVVPSAILNILSSANELAGDVVRYFFSGKGKLLRPALTLLGGECFGLEATKYSRILNLAAAFEIFHGATLIHDDIIDSAYLRRNLPTINVKWGPEVAVLVGDFLHDRAIGTVLEHGTKEILAEFLRAAGTVCDGEIHELHEKDNSALSEDEYFEIIRKKTAVLLGFTVQAGAMLAGASAAQAAALYRYGQAFGIAFQIIDDCLDFTGNENEFGKTLGADCSAGVLTLPLIRILELADTARREELIRLFKSPSGPEKFRKLLDLIRENGTIEYSLEKARRYSDQARRELAGLDETSAKRSLDRLVDYVLERNR